MNLLVAELGENQSERSRVTRMGVLMSRFVDDPFPLPDGRTVVLRRRMSGNNRSYHLEAFP
jgi:hypothetical protein